MQCCQVRKTATTKLEFVLYFDAFSAEPIVDVLTLDEVVEQALSTYAKACGSKIEESEEFGDESNGSCHVVDESDIHAFAASISDGMMDYLNTNDIGQALAEAFFDSENSSHPHSAAENLITSAAMGWEGEFNGQYRDDIAIASFIVPLR